MDPLAEKFHHHSPYNYCENNPYTKIDRDGKVSSWAIAGIGAAIGAAGGFVSEVCHQSVQNSDPKYKFNWNAVWETTAISAAGGAYVGAIVGLLTADPTALLTIKSVSLTTGLNISLNALKGTIQGIVDVNKTNNQNEKMKIENGNDLKQN